MYFGHSVITGSAATILTEYIGDNYTFSDSTEMYLNFKPRTYKSFMAASNEAALSRMYGGIHFRPAIENGQTQGKAVGKYIISKIKTKN
ncbi:MAG: phosphatase PAP2 family protein [Saprospiraceae bacterium]|nr:phosphatase PAP2 family protein [Saprospiraceae bacterium]